jgi:hypothetical protein
VIARLLDRWAERLDPQIDWSGFAITRGCFMAGYFPHEFADERAEKRDVLVASGGLCAPDILRPRWEPWAEWYRMPRLVDLIEPFRVQRGSIRATITDDPYSHLGPGAPPPPSWPAQPAPELPPQPAQPTMNLLEPETRSISDLIRLRLRRRR